MKGDDFAATVDEACSNNFAVIDFFAIQVQLLVNHLEAVAFTDVVDEIDIPAEDAGQFHGDAIIQPGFFASQVKEPSISPEANASLGSGSAITVSPT